MSSASSCRHYRKCSGCSRLQFPYVKQVHDKDKSLRERLGRFVGGGDAPEFEPFEKSPLALAYRSSTKLCLNEDTFGQRTIGLYERGTKTVVDIPDCPVHHASINKLVDRLLRGKAALPAPFYNHAKKAFQPGRLKFLTIRVSPETHTAGIVLSHTGVEREALMTWAKGLREPDLCVYEATVDRDDDDLILTADASHLTGPKTFLCRIAGHDFQLSPLAFFQANFALTDAFVRYVTDDLKGHGLLDLYGGFGAYALAAAPRFKRAWLVDIAPLSMPKAELPGITPVRASVEDFLARLTPGEAQAVTHVIVNPPRAGLSPKVKALLNRKTLPKLEQITYVSCNPETLSRDLDHLTRGGHLKVRSVRGFDMFPQTDHVEAVVRLAP